jgi:hypothetical protein
MKPETKFSGCRFIQNPQPHRGKYSLNVFLRCARRGGRMEHVYAIDDDVRHQMQEPQGRSDVDQTHAYTIIALLPVAADGRLRYRIKSKAENFERIVDEDSLTHLN